MVSFDPKLSPNMEQSKEDHSSIALVNCDIQKAKERGRADFSEYEIVAGMHTTIQKSPKKFKIKDDLVQSLASTVVHSITDISKISVESIVTVMGKVTRVSDTEEVGSKKTLVKQDCYLSDASDNRLPLFEKLAFISNSTDINTFNAGVLHYREILHPIPLLDGYIFQSV